MLHHLKIHFKKMRPKKTFFFRSMSLDPTKPRKKTYRPTNFPKKTVPLNFPSFSLPSSVCSRLDFSTFVMDFTTPDASLLLHRFAHMEPTLSIFGSSVPWIFKRWEVVKLKGGKILGGEPIARWWFQILVIFNPKNLTRIFQMGWNHQLDCLTWAIFATWDGLMIASTQVKVGSVLFFFRKILSFFWSFFFGTFAVV